MTEKVASGGNFLLLLLLEQEEVSKEAVEGLPLVKKDKIKVLKESEIKRLEDLKERNPPFSLK